MKVYGVLLDTRSIQRYIFAGNKLKTNVGASYIVEQIYDKVLVDVLNSEPFNFGIQRDAWKTSNAVAMATNDAVQCEIAYVGGGNAIVLFRSEKTAKDVVRMLSKELLKKAPGLHTGAAIGPIELGESAEAYQKSIDALYASLKRNQNNIVPDVNVPYTGLTVGCEISGDAACVLTKIDGKPRYISAETKAKIDASKEANDNLRNKFKDITDKGYAFTDEIEELGQKAGEEYIAIVHIDGNNMGAKFSAAKSLQERKALSQEIAAASLKAFTRLLKEVVVAEYDAYEKEQLLEKKLFDNKTLPIRPIILGGDDITFVCPARLAVIYAKRFIEFLQEEELHINGEAEPFYSCAGVAILPTKYPFFRGYELAEQLCGEAKKKSRVKDSGDEEQSKGKKKQNNDEQEKGSSWLEYAILHGEQDPELEQLRKQEYTVPRGNLHFGPYRIADINTPQSIERLLLGAKELQKYWPSNKIKGMRDVIRKGDNEIGLFLKQMEHLKKSLPNVEGKLDRYKERLWCDKRTPYLDMIELIDFMYDVKEVDGK